MADNVTLPATGEVIATDDIAGVQYQVVKLAHGAPDTAMPVSLASGLPVQPSTGAVFTTQGVQDTATIGTLSAAGNSVSLTVNSRNVVTAHVRGTYAGLTVVMEFSDDGVNWYPAQTVDVGTGFAATNWTLQTNQSVILEAACGATSQARLRCVAITSGSASVTIAAQAMAYEPVPTSIIQGSDRDFTCTPVSANNGDLFSIDCAGVQSIKLQLTGTWAGTVSFQGSDDGVTWYSTSAFIVNTSSTTTSVTSLGILDIPVRSRYIRCRVTAYTSGTVTGVYRLSSIGNVTASFVMNSIVATQSTASNLKSEVVGPAAHSAAVSGNPVRIGGRVQAVSDTTLVSGDTCDLMATTNGALITKLFSAPELDWQFTNTLTTVTAVAAAAARAAGIRNYVTDVSFQNMSATATTVLLQDGTTTIAQWHAPANMVAPTTITFNTPRRGTAATAMNVNCGTAGASVLINVGGYQAP